MLLLQVLPPLIITRTSSVLVSISLGLGSRRASGPLQPGLQVLSRSLEMPSGAARGERAVAVSSNPLRRPLCPGGHGLQILNAQEEDAGTYSCIVASEDGEAVKSYAVKVLGEGAPHIPPNSCSDPTTVPSPVLLPLAAFCFPLSFPTSSSLDCQRGSSGGICCEGGESQGEQHSGAGV